MPKRKPVSKAWLLLASASFLLALVAHGSSPYQARCTGTLMAIVAHQDDDLLFMNPDIVSALHAGRCVRTVYLTAGDSGGDKQYWRSREQGAEAAYAHMVKSSAPWVEQAVELAPGEVIQIASLKDTTAVTLTFLRLPDGNTNGRGFPSTGYASLAKLLSGTILSIRTVDNQATYTLEQLETTLQILMAQDAPTEVITQSPSASAVSQDHSDHDATGRITKLAYRHYAPTQKSLKFYRGYTVERYPANLSPNETTAKALIFLDYARYDHQACPAFPLCTGPPYQSYFLRQYSLKAPSY